MTAGNRMPESKKEVTLLFFFLIVKQTSWNKIKSDGRKRKQNKAEMKQRNVGNVKEFQM